MTFESYRDIEPLFKIDVCWSVEHFHKSLEIVINLAGDKSFSLAGEQRVMKTGDLLFIMPYETHSFPLDPESKAVCFVLPTHFSEIFLKQTHHKQLLNPHMPASPETESVKNKMLSFFETDNDLQKIGIIYDILGYLATKLSFSDEQISMKKSDFAYTVLTYIEQNYNQPLTLDILASQFGYSRAHFSDMFNKYFQSNLNNYINSVRIYKSLDLLKTSLPNEIYHKLGFNTLQQFFRCFKSIIGITPGQFRESQFQSIMHHSSIQVEENLKLHTTL